jgi:hypothetical protein
LFSWELEDLAREQLAGMPPGVQLALSDFMDAAVIVDPAETSGGPTSRSGRCGPCHSGRPAW